MSCMRRSARQGACWLAAHRLAVTKVLVELKVRFHSASPQKETFRFLHAAIRWPQPSKLVHS